MVSACIFISLILGLTTTKTQDTTFPKEQHTPTHLWHFTRTYQSPNYNNGFQQCWQQWEQASDCCANNEDALLARRDARNPTLGVITRAVDSLREAHIKVDINTALAQVAVQSALQNSDFIATYYAPLASCFTSASLLETAQRFVVSKTSSSRTRSEP